MGLSADTGGGETLDTLKLLADPAALSARIQAFEDARTKAEAVIALVGPAEEIISMREETVRLQEAARADRATASNVYQQAQAWADKTIADATRTAEVLKSNAEADRAAAAQVLSDAKAAAEKIKADADATASQSAADCQKMLQEAKATQDAAQAALADAQKSKADADAARERYETLVAKINAIVSG